jgi:hypothetical protein
VARLVTSTQDPITVHDDFEVKNKTFEKRPSYTLRSKIKTPLSTAGMLLANSAVKLSSRDPSPQVFEKSLPDLIVRADKGLSLKERLNRTKNERLNEDVSKKTLIVFSSLNLDRLLGPTSSSAFLARTTQKLNNYCSLHRRRHA